MPFAKAPGAGIAGWSPSVAASFSRVSDLDPSTSDGNAFVNMSNMVSPGSWTFYIGAVIFFTLLFSAFLAVAWSVLLQVRENYYRYLQRAELQWTGSDSRFPRGRVRPIPVLLLGFLAAWLLVHFVLG
ncbi:MAG: hypothetical protein Kow00109_08350 [Acidobacteriota bacterium]